MTRRAGIALVTVSLAAAVAPIVVAVVRALGHDWAAVGDNALYLIRGRDVFTSHHPLLGTWSSASISVGKSINHPGPLYFDWLAIPTKLAGDGGLAVGVALLNIASIAFAVITANRVAGTVGAIATATAASALGWAMGSELLFDPWQPHSLLFPFLAFLVAVWATLAGDAVMVVWSVAIGSFLVQTHVSYAYLAPALIAVSASALLVAARRDQRAVRRIVMHIAVAGVVGALLWSQPLVEQFFGDGPGNLAQLASSGSGDGQPTAGPALGVRLAADVIASPPFWTRSGFNTAFVPEPGELAIGPAGANPGGLPSLAFALVGLGLVLVAGAAAAFALRRKDRPAAALAATTCTATVAVVATSILLPIGPFGIAQHQLRWLWPVSLFVPLTIIVAAGRLMKAASLRALTVATTAVAVVFCALALPAYNADIGPAADADAIPTIHRVRRQLEPATNYGKILFEVTGLRFPEPWTAPMMAELQRRHVDFVVDSAGWADQLGPARRYTGSADARLFLKEGDDAVSSQPNAERIAFAAGLTAREQGELRRLRRLVVERAPAGGFALSRIGRSATDRNEVPALAGGVPPAQEMVDNHLLSYLVEGRYIELPPGERSTYERYAELQRRWDHLTLGVFVERLSDPPAPTDAP